MGKPDSRLLVNAKMKIFICYIFLTFLTTGPNAYSADKAFGSSRVQYLATTAESAIAATIIHLEKYVKCLTSHKDNRSCSTDNRQRNRREIKYLLNLEIGLLENYGSVFNKTLEKIEVNLSDSRKKMRGKAISTFINLHAIANLLSNKCAKKAEKNIFKDSGVQIYLRFFEENNKYALSRKTTPAYIIFNKKEMEVENMQVFDDVCGEDLRTVMYILTNANRLLLEKIEADKDLALMQFVAAYVAALSILLEKSSP